MLIERTDRYEIWLIDGEYWVYGAYYSGDPLIMATLQGALDVAAGC